MDHFIVLPPGRNRKCTPSCNTHIYNTHSYRLHFSGAAAYCGYEIGPCHENFFTMLTLKRPASGLHIFEYAIYTWPFVQKPFCNSGI